MNLVPDTDNTVWGGIRMGVDPLDLTPDGKLGKGTVPSGDDPPQAPAPAPQG